MKKRVVLLLTWCIVGSLFGLTVVDLPLLMGVLDLCSGRTCGGGCGLQEGKLSGTKQVSG